MHLSQTKARIRARMHEMRRSMSFEDVFSLSSRIQERFLSTALYKDSGRLALYSSFDNEVLTEEILQQAVGSGKEVSFPRVIRGRRHLEFFRVTHATELEPGSYDIREPGALGERVDPASFDLVVVPGVAFDETGARIGYGKGYYDAALSGVHARMVALAYDFQVSGELLPREAHDVGVSAIVTEKRFIKL